MTKRPLKLSSSDERKTHRSKHPATWNKAVVKFMKGRGHKFDADTTKYIGEITKYLVMKIAEQSAKLATMNGRKTILCEDMQNTLKIADF